MQFDFLLILCFCLFLAFSLYHPFFLSNLGVSTLDHPFPSHHLRSWLLLGLARLDLIRPLWGRRPARSVGVECSSVSPDLTLPGNVSQRIAGRDPMLSYRSRNTPNILFLRVESCLHMSSPIPFLIQGLREGKQKATSTLQRSPLSLYNLVSLWQL